MKPTIRALFLSLLVVFAAALPASAAEPQPVDKVWAGHSVGFALTHTPATTVTGYYDPDRRLVIAQRSRTGGDWIRQALDTSVGWDSHNYIALAHDASGRLHVAANMHNVPLIYFMSDESGDVRTLRRVFRMVDEKQERSMTYPVFLKDRNNRLIFKYRDGGSGNGNEIYNVFDTRTATWSRLTSEPLVDGEGQRNAYFAGPVLGPDGWFHLTWVWRDTPMAETNHDLSYARSRDLVHWQKANGSALPLPITLAAADIVDPVPAKGGMINNNTRIGFDDRGQVMITYHKYDEAGDTQIYVARHETGGWRTARVSDWEDYRWDFGGGGSLNFEINVSGVQPLDNGLLKVPVTRLGQSFEFIIRSDDLSRVETREVRALPDRLKDTIAVPEGMLLNIIEDESGLILAWPTLPPNRDKPVANIPSPTTLYLIEPPAH